MREGYWREYERGVNDIQKSATYMKAGERTHSFFKQYNYRVHDWEGVLTRVYTDQGGHHVTVNVESKLGGVPILYESVSPIPRDSSVYRQVSGLRVGTRVSFSMKVFPSKERGIRERSLTEYGSLYAPAFKVQFLAIKRL